MRASRILAAGVVVTLAGGFTAAYFVTSVTIGQAADTTSLDNGASCAAVVNSPSGVAELDDEQLTNAKTIAQVGARLHVPIRGLIVAEATALQESNLYNLNYGDRDSVGLFQQRPSAGWGSVAELTNPTISAEKFYEALLKIHGWQSMPLTKAAQAVQRSAFPRAYAKWETLASTLITRMVPTAVGTNTASLAAINCGETVGAALPSNVVGEMLRVALEQQGNPYLWGGIGPDYFDCSGLIVFSWRKAGYRLSVRTSEQMYQVSDSVPAGTEQPGDLLFGDFNSAGPGHVMIVVSPGTAVEAPRAGDVVKVISYDPHAWTIGRLRPSAFSRGVVPS